MVNRANFWQYGDIMSPVPFQPRCRAERVAFFALFWRHVPTTTIPPFTNGSVVINEIQYNPVVDPDGDFFGLFLDIQQSDTPFLQDFGEALEDALVIKMEGGAQKRAPDCTDDLADYSTFVKGYRNIGTREWLETNVNLERCLSLRDTVLFMQHNDLGGHNFYWNRDPQTQRWELVPGDLGGWLPPPGGFDYIYHAALWESASLPRCGRHGRLRRGPTSPLRPVSSSPPSQA